jgi:AcrR family transcriptional regulator
MRASAASVRRAVARGPGRPRGPSQAARLRERLVAAAGELYASGGYAGISFGALAERTGLRKATLFHYFPNKEALAWAVFNALGERLEAAALNWFDAPPQSCAARLDRLVASLVDFYGADPINARILCHGLMETEQLRDSRVAGMDAPPIFDHFVRRFIAFLEEGIAAGEFHPDRALGTVMAIGGVILFECMLPERGRQLVAARGQPVSHEARKEEIIRFIRRAVVRPQTRLAKQAVS